MKKGDIVKIVKEGDMVKKAYKEAKLNYPKDTAVISNVDEKTPLVQIKGSKMILSADIFEVVEKATNPTQTVNAPMHTFQLGDRVKILRAKADSDMIGEVRTVVEFKDNGTKLRVRGSKGFWSNPTDMLLFVEKGEVKPGLSPDIKNALQDTVSQIEEMIKEIKRKL